MSKRLGLASLAISRDSKELDQKTKFMSEFSSRLNEEVEVVSWVKSGAWTESVCCVKR